MNWIGELLASLSFIIFNLIIFSICVTAFVITVTGCYGRLSNAVWERRHHKLQKRHAKLKANFNALLAKYKSK